MERVRQRERERERERERVGWGGGDVESVGTCFCQRKTIFPQLYVCSDKRIIRTNHCVK